MTKCWFCNHEVPAGAEKCDSCGARLDQAASRGGASAGLENPPAPADEPDPESLDGRILALVRAGQKIPAIKLHREAMQSGLKEAKDAVEALAARHGVAPSGSGCAGVVLLALIVSARAMGWL
jgi:hypothetical protein